MTDTLEDHEGTVSIEGRTITNLRFADDIDGLAGEEEELANLVEHTCRVLPHGTSICCYAVIEHLNFLLFLSIPFLYFLKTLY